MVLDKSDYSLPSPGESFDPLDMDTYTRLVGMIVAVGLAGAAVMIGWRQGRSFVQSWVTRVTGGRVSQSGDAGPREF